MSVLSDYSEEEQLLLLQGPRLGAIVISAASPGRSAETATEGFAAVKYAMSARGEFLENLLVNALLYKLDELAKEDRKFADYNKLAAAAGAKEQALGRLAEAADLLDRKSDPVEAKGYKTWVLNASNAAAEAGKEGGNFFGRGAVMVNDAERAALDEIAKTLRLEP
jgi:hypothetical protein